MMPPATGLLAAQRSVFRADLKSAEKLVLLAMLDHWSANSQRPFPGVSTLARLTSLGRCTVLRAVRALETEREGRPAVLEVCRRPGRSSVYSLAAVFEGRLPVAPVSPRDQSHHETSLTVVRPLVSPRDRDQSHHETLREPVKGTSEGTQTEREPKRSAKKPLSRLLVAMKDPRVQEIAEHYRTRLTPAATWKLDAKHNGKHRAIAVLDRLDAGYTVEQIKTAIDALAKSDWHRESGHVDLELVVRADKIGRFLTPVRKQSAARGPSDVWTNREAYALDNLDHAEGW